MALKSVTAGQSLQTAYQQAQPGDTLSVEAGATFEQLRTTPKLGTGKITIQSSRISELPLDKLVEPSQASLMPKILGPNPEPAIMIEDGAHDIEFLGIEARPTNEQGADVYDIVAGGLDSQTLDAIPKRLLFDRCYIHGLPRLHTKNGLNANFSDAAIRNTCISEIHGLGQESHAIAWFNAPGPIKIDNCYLEAAGIAILSGGAQPRITGLVPSDIEITNNYLLKKLSWMVGHPEYAGIPWNVKNPFELKNARRVKFTGNKAENCWKMGQIGMGLNLNSSTEDSGGWNVVEDVLIARNQFLKMANGFMFAGGDKLNTSSTAVKLKRVTVVDNFIECGFWGGEGKAMQLGQGSEDVTLDHNTFVIADAVLLNGLCALMNLDGNLGHLRLKVLNNLGSHGFYGVFGDGGFMAKAALDKYARDWQFQKNAIYGDMSQGRPPEQYPPDNYFGKTLAEVQSRLGIDGQPVGARTISLPGPIPRPTPQPPQPSPDGTKGVTITDATGGVWTIGTTKNETLRNKVWMGGGQTTEYKYLTKEVYAKGFRDGLWYKWTGDWVKAGDGSEPGGTTQPPEPIPTPVPSPTPTPTPIPEPQPAGSYEFRKFRWPADDAGQDAVEAQAAKDGWTDCYVAGNWLRCKRLRQ